MATYWYRYFLLTPRNVLRKFRIPVHSPSSVLTWISRAPSPSSSRAHSRSAWHTVDRKRPIPGSPLYPCHSSVLTATIGQLARLTTRCNVSPSDRSVTVSRSVPLSRPTTPHTGGGCSPRCRGRGPCSPGAAAGPPGRYAGRLFPRVLVALVGLQTVVVQRPAAAGSGRPGLGAGASSSTTPSGRTPTPGPVGRWRQPVRARGRSGRVRRASA